MGRTLAEKVWDAHVVERLAVAVHPVGEGLVVHVPVGRPGHLGGPGRLRGAGRLQGRTRQARALPVRGRPREGHADDVITGLLTQRAQARSHQDQRGQALAGTGGHALYDLANYYGAVDPAGAPWYAGWTYYAGN